ncbi:hypothetical protein M433DRAFT_157990 [Acidomyces richmondensis BFW]|nr:hypothetical protein M433DRAFT_157990 [Acidomyces richmondensis BFW]
MMIRSTCRPALEGRLFGTVACRDTTPFCYPVYTRMVAQATRTSWKHYIHNSSPTENSLLTSSSAPSTTSSSDSRTIRPLEQQMSATAPNALEKLPLSQILRTYFMTSISSSPILLGASTSILQQMLESNSLFFSIERNPVLRTLLWETFYKQFCAGENATQVQKTCSGLRQQGYGVILEYALELLKDAEGDESKDVEIWKKGMLETVSMAAEGDFVGLKWSGMGSAAMQRLRANEEPSERMEEAMNSLCQAAAEKNVSLLPAAEETWSLEGVNNWSLRLQRLYNVHGKSVVYNTYQAYLRQMPRILAQHLSVAKEEGFTLGVKLVRGAYLGSEDRGMIWPSIEKTHETYDSLAEALIHRRYNDTLQQLPSSASTSWSARHGDYELWPDINVVLATHNATSVAKAQSLRKAQAACGEILTPLVFAQLQGMADEVSCSLIASSKAAELDGNGVKEKVYKCTTWGSMFECLNYLLRRAAENKDAAGRTSETRSAMMKELRKRMKSLIGFNQ